MSIPLKESLRLKGVSVIETGLTIKIKVSPFLTGLFFLYKSSTA